MIADGCRAGQPPNDIPYLRIGEPPGYAPAAFALILASNFVDDEAYRRVLRQPPLGLDPLERVDRVIGIA